LEWDKNSEVFINNDFPGRIHVGDKTYRIVTVTNITVELKEVK